MAVAAEGHGEADLGRRDFIVCPSPSAPFPRQNRQCAFRVGLDTVYGSERLSVARLGERDPSRKAS